MLPQIQSQINALSGHALSGTWYMSIGLAIILFGTVHMFEAGRRILAVKSMKAVIFTNYVDD